MGFYEGVVFVSSFCGKVLIVVCLACFMLTKKYLLKSLELSAAYGDREFFDSYSADNGDSNPRYILKKVVDERTGDVRIQQVENPDYEEGVSVDIGDLEKQVGLRD